MEDIDVGMVVMDHDHYRAVLLCGEIDCNTGPGLQRRLLALADTPDADLPVVLDMSGVAFCDGSALRTLSLAEQRFAERGGSLAIVGLRDFLIALFHAVGLDERIPLCHTLEEALWCVLPIPDEELADWLLDG